MSIRTRLCANRRNKKYSFYTALACL